MPEIPATEIKHNLSRFVPRPGVAFRTQSFKTANGETKEYPFFLTQGKKVFFIHPTREELNLTDDVVQALYADENGEFAAAKSAYFIDTTQKKKWRPPHPNPYYRT